MAGNPLDSIVYGGESLVDTVELPIPSPVTPLADQLQLISTIVIDGMKLELFLRTTGQ